MHACPNCSATLTGHACKLRCPRCAYFESCSDLEPHPPLRPSGERRAQEPTPAGESGPARPPHRGGP